MPADVEVVRPPVTGTVSTTGTVGGTGGLTTGTINTAGVVTTTLARQTL